MSREFLLKMSVAVLGLSVLAGSAYAVPHLDTVTTQWDEGAYYNGFGGSLPAGIVEGSAGFSTIGDYDGRTISLAGVTTNKTDNNPLLTISTGLFSGTDVNTYEIAVTNPALFTASVVSTTLDLAIFNSAGKAVVASVGGPLDILNATNDNITTPGIYYISLSNPAQVPQNAAGGNIFGITSGTAGIYNPVTADSTLATDPNIAFYLPLGDASPLLSNTSFVAAGPQLLLSHRLCRCA